jgi:hypothetical protein
VIRRIQRQRTKGWRMPSGAIYVGRPSPWGNPWPLAVYRRDYPDGDELDWRRMAVSDYRNLLLGRFDRLEDCPPHPRINEIRKALRDRELVCWCPLDQPCHADVLLELANA